MVSRYGVKIRSREKKILQQQRLKHACPSCGKKSVRRVSTALWKCRSCGALFAGGAYSPTTTVGAMARKTVESPGSLKPLKSPESSRESAANESAELPESQESQSESKEGK